MAAIVIFYFIKNPWPIAHFIKSIAGLFLIMAVSFGIGKKTIGWLKLETVTFIEDLSVSLGLGLGILSIIVMVMGGFKLYQPFYAYLVLILLFAFSINTLITWVKTFTSKWKLYSGNRFSFLGAIFLIILVFSLAAAFLSSLAPPASEYGISVSLATARRYIMNGGIYNIPSSYVANLPGGMTMLQVLGLLVYGPSVARLISFLFFLLLAICIYSMTRKFFHRKIALFATAITVSTPFIVKLYLIDHPFIGSIFYSFMALYCFICWSGSSRQIQDENLGWLIMSGIFTACSLSMGFYAMFTPLVLLCMIFYRILTAPKDTEVHEIAAKLLCFIIPFVLFITPLFIRNLIITGSPVFPFFAGRSLGLNIEAVKSLWGYLLPLWYVPFDKEIALRNFFYIGPVYLVFFPGIFLIKEIGKAVRILISYFSIYFIVYLLVGRKLIFLYTLIPVVSIVIAYIIINMYGRQKYFHKAVIGVFLLSIVINFYTIWPWASIQGKIDTALGYSTRSEYLAGAVSGYSAMEYINKHTPSNSKILLLGENRSFYIERDIISHDVWSRDPFIELARNSDNAQELKNRLEKKGLTHIFVNLEEINRLRKYHNYTWNESAGSLFDVLTKKYLKIKFKENNYYVYEL